MWKLSDENIGLLRCLSTLEKKNTWFGKEKVNQEIISILQQVADRRVLPALATVIGLLFSKSLEVRRQAATTIHWLIAYVPPAELLFGANVVQLLRSWDISDAWIKLAPSSLRQMIAELPYQHSILGLLSLHPNGYVRHEAVTLLSEKNDGGELPYLLARQNDWVAQISLAAQTAVNARLNETTLPIFVRHLDLVLHLANVQRRDLAPFATNVVRFLVRPDNDMHLVSLLNSSNREVRRNLCRIALKLANSQSSRILDLALKSADANVRLIAALHLLEDSRVSDLPNFVRRLKEDRQMPVRRAGFRLDAKLRPGQKKEIWQEALRDSHRSIRELARFEIGRIGPFDFAQYYRDFLAQSPQQLTALSGLAETGDVTDIATLERYLKHPQPRFRQAAIVGLGRIQGENASSTIVEFIGDSSPRVVREAIQQMERNPNHISAERLLPFLKEGQHTHVCLAVVRLLASMGKWRSLPWLIRAAALSDIVTREAAQKSIEAWFSPPLINKVFTTPSNNEWTQIKTVLAESRTHLDGPFAANLDEWLRGVRVV